MSQAEAVAPDRRSLDVNKLMARVKARESESPKSKESVAQTFGQADPDKANGVLLTTPQVQRMFDVTNMTIHNWRNHRGMPYAYLKGGKKPPVRYDEGLLVEWAKLHGQSIIYEDYKSF